MVPALHLRFAATESLVDWVSGRNLVTFTRASIGTRVTSAGVLETLGVDVPRFTYDPVSRRCLGLLVEESRANRLLNSATLSTQNVTVTAVTHTLHFTGTGTVTLSGASTAGPLVGTGTGEANRVSLQFTPSAGTLTVTVSGTVSDAQLEIGSTPSSYIPTLGAIVTRAADLVAISGSNFASFFNQPEGTLIAEGITSASTTNPPLVELNDNTSSNRILIRRVSASNRAEHLTQAGGATQASISVAGFTANTMGKAALSYAADYFNLAFGGLLTRADTSGTVPTVNQMSIGFTRANAYTNGPISQIVYGRRCLDDSALSELSR